MKTVLTIMFTALLSIAAYAKPQTVTLWVGDTYSADLDDRQAEQNTVTATSDDPKIAKSDFKKSNNGTILITGVDEGTTKITIEGDERVINAGIKKRDRAKPLNTQKFKFDINVKVIKPEVDVRGIVIRVGQSADIKMPKGARIVGNKLENSQPQIASAKKRTGTAIKIKGLETGETYIKVKYTIKGKGKTPTRYVRGTIKVKVWDKEKGQEKLIKKGWDGLATKEIVIVEDASFEEGTEPISDTGSGSFDCCYTPDLTVVGSLGVASMVGSDLVDAGVAVDVEVRSAFNALPGEFFSNVPNAESLYAFGGFGLYNFGSSDMYVDDVTGWSIRGGVGGDVCMGENVGPGGDWCWSLGGQAFVSFTSLTLNGEVDESDSSLGVGVLVGPRVQHANSGWGAEANVGGTVFATEMDFGLDGADGSRLTVFGNVGVSYSF